MAHPATKNTSSFERLEARISTDKKNLLKNAADLSGRTLTEFVINSACEAAARIIQEYQQLHLSVKDRAVFVDVLLNAPNPSDKLLIAAKKYKKDIVSK